MKKYLLLFYLSLFILLPKTQFAQWTTVLDDGKYHLVGIEFKDENIGFAGGVNMESDSNVIIRTMDGGITWDEVYTETNGYVTPFCFDFINDTIAISGGENGAIFKSIDGGDSWEYISYSGNDIFTIRFFNDTIGIASGKRTLDGGYTWTWMDIGFTSDIFLVDDSSGFVTSGSGILYTSDYGESWIKVDPCQNEAFSSVCMATDQVGYAAKQSSPTYISKLYKTIDGGMSWFEINSLELYEVKQMRFTDENTGYILSNTNWIMNSGSMRVLKTTDGGNSWDYVLFGNDYSFQMAFADDETILVPTVNGIMYKTINGGGIGPTPKHTEIDWFSEIWKISKYLGVNAASIDSTNRLYVSGFFKDTLVVNQTFYITSDYHDDLAGFILKYNSWGGIDWYTVIEEYGIGTKCLVSTVDKDNNYYVLVSKWSNNEIQLRKYNSEGDPLWTKSITYFDYNNTALNTNVSGNIYLSGEFQGSLVFDGDSIHTNNYGLFFLEIDANGNVQNLKTVVEAIYGFSDTKYDINDEGSICLSFGSYGSVFINSDTIESSKNYLLLLDSNYDLTWYWNNNEFEEVGEHFTDVIFNTNSSIVVNGRVKINWVLHQILYKIDILGNTIDTTYIFGNNVSTGSSLCSTQNNRILTGGSYQDFVVIEDDTLFGFDLYNTFLYTLSDDLELVKSSQISGSSGIISILENQHNSFLVSNNGNRPVIFANDTIFASEYARYYIAKLNSIITPVYEKDEYNSVLVYPNPTTGLLILVFPEGSPNNGFIEIYSITGQKVYEDLVSEHNHTLDLSKVIKGIYFIQLSLEKMIYSEKIIIQ